MSDRRRPVPLGGIIFSWYFALILSLGVMLFAFTGGRLSRREGAVMVALYLGYTAYTAGLV